MHTPVSYTHLDVYKRQMYGSESWTLTQNQRKRIQAAEIQFLRESKDAP